MNNYSAQSHPPLLLLEKSRSRPADDDERGGRAPEFFDGINWDRALEKKLTPPFVPTVSGPMDIGNIDEKYTRGFPAVDSPVSSAHGLSPSKSALFSGFSWRGLAR